MNEKVATIIEDNSLILYYTGFTVEDSYLVLFEDNKYLFTDMRYYDGAIKVAGLNCILNSETSVSAFLKNNGVNLVKMPFNFTSLAFYKILEENGFKIIDNFEEISNTTAVKSSEEISLIKKSCEICEKSFYDLLPFIKEGISENQLLAELEYIFKQNGADGVAFNGIVAFNEGSAIPHYKTGNVKLKKGSPILMDFGCSYKGYLSDMTRTLFFGEPDKEFLYYYNLVKDAQNLAYSTIKGGISGFEADKIARDYFKNYNCDKYFTHSLGHGVGVKIHESPNLSPKSNYVLKNGNVFSVEPGLYLSNRFGIRIEDTVYMVNEKCVSFMKSDKNLIVL